MSTVKYTPGPWHVGEQNVWAKRTKICDKPTQAEMYREKTVIEQKSNFALIAAAPELFEALKFLLAEEWRDNDDPILNCARSKARAAIAKAEGVL